jgi:hypothetical protein
VLNGTLSSVYPQGGIHVWTYLGVEKRSEGCDHRLCIDLVIGLVKFRRPDLSLLSIALRRGSENESTFVLSIALRTGSEDDFSRVDSHEMVRAA